MKRLLLLPIVMLGLSFACDQPYEEVAGIKIGCPVSSVEGIGLFSTTNSGVDGLKGQSKAYGGAFFETITILTSDGVVVGVHLESEDGSFSLSDIRDLTLELDTRWGKSLIKKQYEGAAERVYRNTNSEAVSSVEVSSDPKVGYVDIVYLTKEASARVDESRRKKIEREKNKFKGL